MQNSNSDTSPIHGDKSRKVEIRELPAPGKFSKLVGPGVIIVATAIGSGEIFFWPGITMKYGFLYLWPALLSVYLQHILNTEFARYTLATGETAISGFCRIWSPFGIIFLLCSTLPWIWPGWSMGAATTISWILPIKAELLAGIFLLVIGISLSTVKIVYKAVELLQLILTVFIVITVIFLVIFFVTGNTIDAVVNGLTTIPYRLPSDIKLEVFISALAFCGAGGTINLATSNWIRDKGLGMGKLVPKVTNPLTGVSVSTVSHAFFFEASNENISKWKKWWRQVKQEQTITFLIISILGLVLLMMLSHALLQGRDLPIGMDLIKEEGRIIGEKLTGWGTLLFFLMAFAVFFTTALGVMDHVSRVTADILKNNFEKIRTSTNKYFSESYLYFYVLWGIIGFSLFILFGANITNTPKLLSTAGVLSCVVMALYSCLILIMDLKLAKQVEKFDARFKGQNPFEIGLWRKLMLVLAIIFYGGLSYILVVETVKNFL